MSSAKLAVELVERASKALSDVVDLDMASDTSNLVERLGNVLEKAKDLHEHAQKISDWLFANHKNIVICESTETKGALAV